MSNSISHWGNAHWNRKEMPRETPHPASVKVESLQIPSVAEYVEQPQVSYLTGGHAKWCFCCGKQLDSFLRSHTYVCLAYGPAIGLLGIYPRVKKAYAHSEKLHLRVHRSFVCDSPKPETTAKVLQQKNGWTHCDGSTWWKSTSQENALLAHTTPRGNLTKIMLSERSWNKNECILYDSIYIKPQKIQAHLWQPIIHVSVVLSWKGSDWRSLGERDYRVIQGNYWVWWICSSTLLWR